MYVTLSPEGPTIQGHIEDLTLPLLFGLLEQARVTGELALERDEASCIIGWESGAIVGIEWNHETPEFSDTKERTIVSALVKQSGALFTLSEGSFQFQPMEHSPIQQLPPGRLPMAFFIRYGLASTSHKALTHQIFDAALTGESFLKLQPDSQLKTLGTKAEELLDAYRAGAQVRPHELDDNVRQLLVALWCCGQVSVTPTNKFNKTVEALHATLTGQKESSHKALRVPFSSLQGADIITEVDVSGEAYKGLLSVATSDIVEINGPAPAAPPLSPRLEQAGSRPNVIVEILREMDTWGASDLFLSQGKVPAIRLHGHVIPIPLPPTDLAMFDAFFQMALGDQARKRFQDSGDLDFGYSLDTVHRFRINLHRQTGMLALVARAIPTGALTFEELGLPNSLRAFASQPRGLVLVTGATGSGKSTTLAAMLHAINTHRHAHIVTIEEPIEFLHKDVKSRITQRAVGADTASFHTALRHVVRESPDVILIGEMRDMETMSVALSAALTGHLVLASLHTIDAVQTLQRIMSYFPEHLREQVAMDLSMSLQGIVSQRLLPTQQGKGRVAAIEILACTPAVSQLLRQQRIDELSDYLKMSADPHTQSFNRSLMELYRKGTISYEVGRAYATNPEEFALSAQGMQTGVSSFQHDGDDKVTTGLDMKSLLQLVLERKASDLHLTTGRPPILRINGKLKPLPYAPLTEGDMRLLLFSILSVRQRTTYQLEREIDFALAIDAGERFRVNAYFQKGKMAAALRAIPSEIPDPSELEIPEQVMYVADQPHGLLLVVGPTGSGKSTTLACMLNRINHTRSCRIITIEDPIEFTHNSKRSTVDQRELHADTKSFAAALKFILRQDPDVILVGEMRDQETISAALTAAETGHLVLATLHTNNATQTIDRIVDVYPSHQQPQVRSQLAASLVGVISQRLLPRNKEAGRIAAFEIMMANPAIRNMIREDKMHQAQSIIESSRNIGMITLDYSLQELYQSGKIDLETAMRYIHNPGLLTGDSKNKNSAYYR